MNQPVLRLAVCLVMLCGCQKMSEAIIREEPATIPVAAPPFVQYTIPKGSHYTTGNKYTPVETRSLHFIVRFDQSAVYQSISGENQEDINKLYGFSDNNEHHHRFSARFGWSWTNNRLWLYAYTYNDGKRSSRALTTIGLGEEVPCSIILKDNCYQFWVKDSMIAALPRAAATIAAKGYLLYPYFGGDETAPHDVNIWIKDL